MRKFSDKIKVNEISNYFNYTVDEYLIWKFGNKYDCFRFLRKTETGVVFQINNTSLIKNINFISQIIDITRKDFSSNYDVRQRITFDSDQNVYLDIKYLN